MTASQTISPHPRTGTAAYADDLERLRRSTQARVGAALEKARRRLGVSRFDAAERLGLTERDMEHFEQGVRTPSPSLLNEFAAAYGTKVEAFGSREMASRVPPHIDWADKTLWIGWTPIPLGAGGNRQVVHNLGVAIRSMRNADDVTPLYLRERELPLIASLLDLTDEDLPLILMRELRLSYTESMDTLMKMEAAFSSVF